MNYDKIYRISTEYDKIEYGIIYGNEKIVFIKTGASGNIKGYCNKYLKMGYRIHNSIGATIICSSNPDVDMDFQIKADKTIINKISVQQRFENYEMYFVGTSDGGYYNLLLSYDFPQTIKYLGINSSYIDLEDFVEKIQRLPDFEKIFVYGEDDESYNSVVQTLNNLECKTLKFISLEGIDHGFTGRIDDFITLADLIVNK